MQYWWGPKTCPSNYPELRYKQTMSSPTWQANQWDAQAFHIIYGPTHPAEVFDCYNSAGAAFGYTIVPDAWHCPRYIGGVTVDISNGTCRVPDDAAACPAGQYRSTADGTCKPVQTCAALNGVNTGLPGQLAGTTQCLASPMTQTPCSLSCTSSWATRTNAQTQCTFTGAQCTTPTIGQTSNSAPYTLVPRTLCKDDPAKCCPPGSSWLASRDSVACITGSLTTTSTTTTPQGQKTTTSTTVTPGSTSGTTPTPGTVTQTTTGPTGTRTTTLPCVDATCDPTIPGNPGYALPNQSNPQPDTDPGTPGPDPEALPEPPEPSVSSSPPGEQAVSLPGVGGCLSDISVTPLPGVTVTIPLSQLCPWLSAAGYLILTVAYIAAARILTT